MDVTFDTALAGTITDERIMAYVGRYTWRIILLPRLNPNPRLSGQNQETARPSVSTGRTETTSNQVREPTQYGVKLNQSNNFLSVEDGHIVSLLSGFSSKINRGSRIRPSA